MAATASSAAAGRTNSRRQRRLSRVDDTRGHFIVRPGLVLQGRYEVVELVGEGTYAKVVRCMDTDSGEEVALKIFRNKDAYRDAAYSEIQILGVISGAAPCCAPMLSWFETLGHVVVAMELYPASLYSFMLTKRFQPLAGPTAAAVALQMLYGLQYLHGRDLVHTDLKPENVVLRDTTCVHAEGGGLQLTDPRVLMIDFGSSWALRQNGVYQLGTKLITTRHYRAPEVVLGLGWGTPSDMWSMGCVLHELLTGECLFMTHSNVEHLAMMEKYIGVPVPPVMSLRADAELSKLFDRRGELRWRQLAEETVPHGEQMVQRLRPMVRRFANDDRLVSLLAGLFSFSPASRLTVAEAIAHPYFDGVRDSVVEIVREHWLLPEDDPSVSVLPSQSDPSGYGDGSCDLRRSENMGGTLCDSGAAPDPREVMHSSEFWSYFEPAVDPAAVPAEDTILESPTLPPVRSKNGRLFFFEEDPPQQKVMLPQMPESEPRNSPLAQPNIEQTTDGALDLSGDADAAFNSTVDVSDRNGDDDIVDEVILDEGLGEENEEADE
jgi:serine/threonine protein kinase